MATIDFRQVAIQAAQRAGIDPNIFVRQINQESGFQPGVTSGAGAQGIAQIVPRYHPDAPPASDPVGQLNWAANYMAGLIKQTGSYAGALSEYNSGSPTAYKDPNFAGGQTYRYVNNILGGQNPKVTGATSGARSLATAGKATVTPSTVTPTSANAPVNNFAPLLASLFSGTSNTTPTPVVPKLTMPQMTMQQPTQVQLQANPWVSNFPTPQFTPTPLQGPVTPQIGSNDDALFSSMLQALARPRTTQPTITSGTSPAPPSTAPSVKTNTNTAAPGNGKELIKIQGPTDGLNGGFLTKVQQAVRAVGGTELIIHSGYRSPSHNAAVGGVPDSNHTFGRAIDGYAVINGKQVPLGIALKPVVDQFGLRSGDVPGFYRGGPDTVHVDDGFNLTHR